MARSNEIYLDDNATTRVLPLAAKVAQDVMEELYGNPSSSHVTGLRARHILETAREDAKQVLGAGDGRVIFTSGATEAIETGVFSALCAMRETIADTPLGERLLLYGATEHKAVPQALQHWNNLLNIGCQVLAIPVDQFGQLDRAFLRDHIANAAVLCTMAVNNETGVIQDLDAISRIVESADHPVAWLVDCVQAVGKIDLDLSSTLVDYGPISGHKLYSPKGVGGLYVKAGAALTPLIAGGGQEGGARGGTENLPGVAALAAVLGELLDHDSDVFSDGVALTQFRDRFIASLEKAFPKIVFNTPFGHSVATTINFSVPGFTSKELLDLFDAAGIRVSSGSACGSSLIGSYVLDAMGLPKWQSEGAIRMSFGPATKASDVTAACERIEEAGLALSDSCLVVRSEMPIDQDEIVDGLLQLKIGTKCSWILSDAATRRCVIIDPFVELVDRIEALVRCQSLKVMAVLDTHKHVDHESPRAVLAGCLGIAGKPADIECDDLGWPAKSDGTLLVGDNSKASFIRLSDSKVLARVPLPGHTAESWAFLVGPDVDAWLMPAHVQYAFCGDTLLIGGMGRTDFPTSDPALLFKSLRNLSHWIAPHTVICPTHDYTSEFVTTLNAERAGNPFLVKVLDAPEPFSVDTFLAEKNRIDSEIVDGQQGELVCGLITPATAGDSASINLRLDELDAFVTYHGNATIVDVRERHEFHFEQEWHLFGFDTPPTNVPLTRFADFLSLLLANDGESSNQEIIFLCRSGRRSGKAAEVARRLGIQNAWHVAGGIALGTRPKNVEFSEDDLDYVI